VFATPEDVSATPEELKSRIEAGIPGAVATVSGDGHHFNAVVTAAAFEGMPRLAQHRLVYDVFGAELGDRIHALSIQTRTS
jgi:acid stress-induced BolA-like protein IbaG/YrbA